MLKKLLIGMMLLGIVLGPALSARASTTLNKPGVALAAVTGAEWPMSGANPQRTSRTSEEVTGSLSPEWYRVIEPYIPAKAQLIAANGMLYVSTAQGLYALDAANGSQRWLYSTEFPLGNSPTIVNGVAYVGGLDRRVHAIDANSGAKLWAVEVAQAGFDTNPLVVNNIIMLGSRDGSFYALNTDGSLKWKYTTAGPIHFSAAYQNGVVYFVSDDGYAYALNEANGSLVWKSAKLPNAGFSSWWPVVNGNAVILGTSRGYRTEVPPGIYSNVSDSVSLPMGTQSGSIMQTTNAVSYLENNPQQRSYIFLNMATGAEITWDVNGNGKPDYAPLLNYGTHAGNRYPAVIAADGSVWTPNNYGGTRYAHGVAGWAVGTTNLRVPNTVAQTWDEPLAASMGGNLVYWTQCCDRQAGSFNISTGANSTYWGYGATSLRQIIPGYDTEAAGYDEESAVKVFAGKNDSRNGVYGYHGDQNPPIPYNGRVYVIRSNAVIALSAAGGRRAAGTSAAVAVTDAPVSVNKSLIQTRLDQEIQKIISTGHLRPGYLPHALWAIQQTDGSVGDHFVDYFSNPADTFVALLRALPYVSASLQPQLRTYLQNEWAAFSPADKYTHTGWSGAAREYFDVPSNVVSAMTSATRDSYLYANWSYPGWTGDPRWNPYQMYAVWKYAEVLGNARSIFDSARGRLSTPPSDAVLAQYPEAHNAWLAGLRGYVELEKLAGYTTNITQSSRYGDYMRLLNLRVSNFTTNVTAGPDPKNPMQAFAVAKNFMYLTPEIGAALRSSALAKIQAAWNDYREVAPYWFVSRFEVTYNEGVVQNLHDQEALFNARAWIFSDNADQLYHYLDVPAFRVGDLYYIQNLVSILAAGQSQSSTPTPPPASTSTPTVVPPMATQTVAPTATTPPAATPTRTSTAAPSATPTQTSTALPSPTSTALPNATPTVLPPSGGKLGPVVALANTVGLYQKFEIKFTVSTTQNVYLPYSGSTGISVDAVITAPDNRVSAIPCFYYQPVDANLIPTGQPDWRCRYTPDQLGTWSYSVKAQDAAGTGQSAPGQFTVIPSASHGFLKVASDTRFFEFSDGTPFYAPLINIETSILNGLSQLRSSIPALAQAGTRFVRWFPNDEGANYYIIPFGGNLRASWGFGSAGTVANGADAGRKFAFKPEYYTWQDVVVNSGRTYSLKLRASVNGSKVLRLQAGSATRDIAASGWQTYILTTTATSGSLQVAIRDQNGASGSIRVDDIQLREWSNGVYGPNLIARGLADTFAYVDQVGASGLDEVLRLSEQSEVYHKLTLFHKNDEVLGALNADGTVTDNPSLANFYNSPIARQYQIAYARYFTARWGYSTALQSVEFANENDISTESDNASRASLQVVKNNQPRDMLISNSFFGYLPTNYWSDPMLKYADKHWYARPDSSDPDLVSLTYQDIAANVRQCQLRFDQYRSLAKPIVRGETGVWVTGSNVTQLDLGAGRANYYHKQLWSQAGDQCAGEWYTSGINLSEYAAYQKWLAGETLNRGGYIRVGTDLTGTQQIALSSVSGSIRAWGYINPTAQRGFLWIDNAQDTWFNVKNGTAIASASATFTINGLPGGTYSIEMVDTATGNVLSQATAGTPSFRTSSLQHDIAVRVIKQGTTPTSTSTPVSTATPLPTASATPTRTPTVLPTNTPTRTPTVLPINTRTPTPTATKTTTAVATNTPTRTNTPVPTTGLVLAFGFNENTGTTVNDASGLHNTGTIANATWTAGKFGQALWFNGSNAWVTVNNATSLNLTNRLTLEAWVYPTKDGGWRTVVMKESSANYYLDSSNGSFAGAGPSAGLNNGSYRDVYGSSSLPLNTWSHLAATWDGTTFRVYVNGVQVASKAVSGIIASTTNPLHIGGNSVWGEFFAGKIDEVRIYNRVLSQTEIQADMNAAIK
jgi:hypothetical protein